MSQALIRSLLRKSPDGLTGRELMAATGNSLNAAQAEGFIRAVMG